MSLKVIFLLADYGHDPTELAIPWSVFEDAGFDIYFATEHGKKPACDEMMLSGWTGLLLGANRTAKQAYHSLNTSCERFQHPLSWEDDSFSLENYDLVFLPGGHEKGVRQIITSSRIHHLLALYFPLTRKPSRKFLGAICHGVQVLAMTKTLNDDNGRSVLHDVDTTALPAMMETGIFYATWPVLGDYYKTFGAGTDTVQDVVTACLDDPGKFKNSLGLSPFVCQDAKYNYASGRFPPDAEMLAQRLVAMVRNRV